MGRRKPGFFTKILLLQSAEMVKKPGFFVSRVPPGLFYLPNAFCQITIACQPPPASADFRLEPALLSPFPQQLFVDR
jgi:hypothetical protein